jgi:quercetin dioxygenase-like cupin family protein
MTTYPYTIENGAVERLTFMRRVAEPDGYRVEGECLAAPGAGPPMHVHYLQEEAFTVVQGRIGYQRGSREPEFAGPGESIVFPAGEPHRFWNAGPDDLRCTAYISPAGNAEYFLATLFSSQKSNGGRRPGLMDMAFLTRRYRTEYAMLAIPALVQRVVFPVLVAIGGMLGTYAKYADAPEPLRHSSARS